MDTAGTRIMRILGIPTYLVALGLLVMSPLGIFMSLVGTVIVPLLYELIYCKTLYAYNKKASGKPKIFIWLTFIFGFQAIYISLLFYLIKAAS